MFLRKPEYHRKVRESCDLGVRVILSGPFSGARNRGLCFLNFNAVYMPLIKCMGYRQNGIFGRLAIFFSGERNM
jgi:hypothetical protein